MGDIRPIGLTPVRTLIAGDSGTNRTLLLRLERGPSSTEGITSPISRIHYRIPSVGDAKTQVRTSGAAGRASARGDPDSDRQDLRHLSWTRRSWTRLRCSRSSRLRVAPPRARRPRAPQDHPPLGRPARQFPAGRPPSRAARSAVRSAERTGRSSAVRRRSRAGRARPWTARRRT